MSERGRERVREEERVREKESEGEREEEREIKSESERRREREEEREAGRINSPAETAAAAAALQGVSVTGESQLLQHVDVLLLQAPQRHHEPLDVAQHLQPLVTQWHRGLAYKLN